MNLDYQKICEMYASGRTLIETATVFGISMSTAYLVLVRSGVPRRAAGRIMGKRLPEVQRGAMVCLDRKHARLRAALGSADHCEQCGTSDPTKLYDWANQTGNYDDFHDFKQMCRACHTRFDRDRRKLSGEFTRKEVVPIGLRTHRKAQNPRPLRKHILLKREYRESK